MSLSVSIPLSGHLSTTDGLQLRQNSNNKATLYFILVVKEPARNGKDKTHYLSCVATGHIAENLHYSVQNGLVTTSTRFNIVAGLDTYTKTMNDPQTGKSREVQQTSYAVWEMGVSARFAPFADVSSPGFQRYISGQPSQQNQPQAQPQQGNGYAPQQNQPQQGQGSFQNQPQQGNGYAPQQNQPQQGQGSFQNQPQQGNGYAPQQDQPQAQPRQGQGSFQNQPQQGNGYAPQQNQPQQGQGSFQNQPQQGNGYAPQQDQPQAQPQQGDEQGKSMRDQLLSDGDDF
ncbi:hypothetical protein [Glutamicibacter ardleyensis]|uniref:hypothetical protein n=1 Tax=Glutamicibacter ardleyensis TaxID=225894 RepID=UPI003FD3661F